MSTLIVVPTWSNVQHLIITCESLRDMTCCAKYRLLVIDNGSTDQTQEYLKNQNIENIRNETNLGFIKAMNQGLERVRDGENVMWLNDDVQCTDPYWLQRLEGNLRDDVGAVGPVTNFCMGLQQVTLSAQIPTQHHSANFLIGFCMLVRHDAFRRVGFLDTRYGYGGNDDLDYCIRLVDAGYKLLIDRSVFVLHYGAKSIERIGGYDVVEKQTRPLLLEKWGQTRVDKLFELPQELQSGLRKSDG